MKKKLLIFPFNRESEPLVHCGKFLADYEMEALVSFSGSGLVAGTTVSPTRSADQVIIAL